MDEKGSETDVSRGGSVGKDGADGAVVPETILNSPLAAVRFGIESAEEQLGTTDCAFVGASSQGSEVSKGPPKAGMMLIPPVGAVPHDQNIIIREGPNQEF